MARKKADTFEVRQGVDPRYLRNTLTKDITPLEAIYDLVDNAVDAARERILQKGPSNLDQYGLPADYSPFRIRLRIGRKSIALWDNCTGIDETRLADQAFVTGFVSEHRYGIGGFGIGLKRALFRLGTVYTLSTDTGISASLMKFERKQLGDSNRALTATRIHSTGRAKTLLHISSLQQGVRHEFGSSARIDAALKQLSRRYGLYISKGFRISINGKRIPPFGPGIRMSGPVTSKSFNMRTKTGVRIYIDTGMHEAYRLTQESDYVASISGALTDQYGWYFVCNDRIVKIASHEKELGWSTNWHPEYYGFVGWVRFVAENPDHLPWDTKKTTIDNHSPAFLTISEKLQKFAEEYKTGNKKARRRNREPPPSVSSNNSTRALPGSTPTSLALPISRIKAGKTEAHAYARDKNDHNENWNTLLPTMRVGIEHDKIRALVYEASSLGVDNPYAASMLFRAIVEFALFEHLKASRKYKSVREAYFEKQEKAGRALTESQKKTFRPTLSHALEWLSKNDNYFPEDVRRECIWARNKFNAHLKELNGIVHEGDLTDSGKLKIVRNDTMPMLRFLLNGHPHTDG